MCSTHTHLREVAAKFIKKEDWVTHLECNEMSDERVKGGNLSDPKPVSAPFFTPSSSSSSSAISSNMAQYPSQPRPMSLSHSQSKSWINHDNHVKVTDASCRYGKLLNTTEVNKCTPHNTIHVSVYNELLFSY